MDTEANASRWERLAHPLVLVLLTLWLANDHVWKARYGTWWTGKLSDVAGLVVFPLLVAALVPNTKGCRPIYGGVGATAALFIAINVSPSAADVVAAMFVSPLVGASELTADLSDLLLLPLLVAPVWLWNHPFDAWPVVRRAAGRVVMAVGMLASTATTGVELDQQAAQTVEFRIDEFVVVVAATQNDPSGDAGRPIRSTYISTDGVGWDEVGQEISPVQAVNGSSHACSADNEQHCFRSDPSQPAVYETLDGWKNSSLVWEIDPGRRQFLTENCNSKFRVPVLYPCRAANFGEMPIALGMTGGVERLVVVVGTEGVVTREVQAKRDPARWVAVGEATRGPADLTAGPVPWRQVWLIILFWALLWLLAQGWVAWVWPRELEEPGPVLVLWPIVGVVAMTTPYSLWRMGEIWMFRTATMWAMVLGVLVAVIFAAWTVWSAAWVSWKWHERPDGGPQVRWRRGAAHDGETEAELGI